jgi:opacity protein-like surface antigen
MRSATDAGKRPAASAKGIVVMSWLKVSAAFGVLAAQVTTTMAADMPRTLSPPGQPLPIVERSQPRVIDINSGWYLRGDLGYAWGRVDSAQSAPGFVSPSTSSLGNGMTGGIGAGIKSKWLRTDVTVDYTAPLKYQGMIAAPNDVTAKLSAWSVLFNGYLDLGTWYLLSPYIGAGAGAAYVRASDYESALAPPFSTGLSNSKWNFAWAAMAGLGYALSSNLIVDFGYRYINFGDARTAADASGSMTFKNLAAHEMRVGLRWSFDDLPSTR